MVFGPDGTHHALPLALPDLLRIRDAVSTMDASGIERLISSWALAIVHTPPPRPLEVLIPFVVQDESLGRTELSRRTRNSLNRAGWWTLREAATASLSEISTARHIGSAALTEFVTAYIRHALTAAPKVEPELSHGVLLSWLSDVVEHAAQRGIREVDIHVVERGDAAVAERESLFGLPVSAVAAEIAAAAQSAGAAVPDDARTLIEPATTPPEQAPR
jgi:hypothetical protein